MYKFLLIILLAGSSFAQSQKAELIIDNVINKFSVIDDYQADLKIEVDMKFLRIPKVNAKVYFKQPNKIHMETKDFAVLPKQGINFSPYEFLTNDISSIYVKTDTLEGSKVDLIKIIPLSDSSNILISSLWIDSEEFIIRKIESTSKNSGTFILNLKYDEFQKYALPSKVIFDFNVSDMQLPEAMDMNPNGMKKPLKETNNNIAGQIIVNYSNYKINQGISDDIFEQETKDKATKK